MFNVSNQQEGEGVSELDTASKKLLVALLEPDFIKTLITIWATMAGTIFILWLTGELAI